MPLRYQEHMDQVTPLSVEQQPRRALNRESMSKEARSAVVYDLVIVGGGIHGTALSRLAAASGIRTLLLEKSDLAYGISSRSSKMLHGGVRYLEQGNVSLVKEALRERALFLLQAPHLCRVQEFLLPILPASSRPAWQMRIGLFLYDLLGWLFRPAEARQQALQFTSHRALTRDSPQWQELEALGCHPQTLLSYTDGQMDDTRLVIEHAIDAVALGATVLTQAEVQQIEKDETTPRRAARFALSIRDHLAAETWQVRAKFVVNLAGPWVQQVHERWKPWPRHWPTSSFARGTHLLFDFPWPTDGLIMPTREKGRYYFVWPYFSAAGAATLVGPTSVACAENEDPCIPTAIEVEELLEYLQRDFPAAGFAPERISHGFAGMRVLAGARAIRRGRTKKVSALSRDDVFLEEPDYLALLGGKYTTAAHTAEKILVKVARRLNKDAVSLRRRPLPGGSDWSAQLRQDYLNQIIEGFALAQSVETRREAAAAVDRFGSRALRLLEYRTDDAEPGLRALFAAVVRYCSAEEGIVDPAGVFHRLGWDDVPELVTAYGAMITEEFYIMRARDGLDLTENSPE